MFSQAMSNYIIYPGMQSNALSLSHTDISAQAAEFAFHESNIRGESWMPDNTDYFRNVSGNPVGSGGQILEEGINRITQNIDHHPGENAAVLSEGPQAGFSKGIEDALASWDSLISESRQFDEYFAALGND